MSLPTLATHSGKFHCDEVFAYAALRLALGLNAPGADHVLLRTRKPELLADADIVFDVGLVYDAAAKKFDHHQRGAPVREDGTPFSAAGLVWQEYGERAVAALLAPEAADLAPAVAAEIERKMVRRIDEVDNGVSPRGPVTQEAMELASLVGDFNPSWDDPASDGPNAGDEAFLGAAAMVLGVLRNRVNLIRAKLAAEAIVLAAYAAGDDARILVLDQGMPWKNVVFSHELPVIFTVSPASNGNWMVDTMPPEPGSFAQRLPLPEAWAGLDAAALAAESGVADAVFVHVRRFVGAAKSRAGALEMAKKALSAG